MPWVYNQLRFMNDFDSIVLADTINNLSAFPWNPIYTLGKNERYSYKLLHKLRIRRYPKIYDTAIKREQPKILHSHFGDKGWHDLPLARKHKIKHVVTFYGYDVNMLPSQKPIWKMRYRELFDKAHLFLCEGRHMAKCLRALGCPPDKIKVQHLGIDIENIPYKPRKIAEDGILRVLIAGTFREKKGIPYALEAVGVLREKYPNVKVTIIGDSAGQEREELEKRKINDIIKRNSLEQVVTMLGFQPYSILMAEAYKHHVFLSPSITAIDGDTEGGAPVTIIEMAASGMPIVSTTHCDIPEVMNDGKSGYLAEERDISGLVKHLIWFIENQENWEGTLLNERKHIEENYSIKKQIQKLGDLYHQLI
jgi:colanic acid/amylovoran biosynthesis glycosyltransferase